MIGVAVGTSANNVFGLTGMFVCASGLSTKQAAAIDVIIDGALPATQIGANVGNLRANSGPANPLVITALPSAAAYNETAVTDPWTVCMKIG